VAVKPDVESPKSRKPRRVVVDFDLLRKVAGANFRDLGGHPTRDRRRVRRGRVYRSAHLAELPEESPLRSLSLRTLITLQSRVEVSHLGPPEQTLLESVRWEHIPIGDRWFEDQDFAALSSQPGREHLALVTYFRDDWRAFFSILAERNVYPLLFHCSAGRDRTGVGAAMLLELLGVERDRIAEDFLQSNLVFRQMPLSAAQLSPVFEWIDQHGGIDGFMREVIGLEPADLESIRADLLEG
jgi:protein-tyrosine phosphatase